jgi:hypothetical protein
MQYKRALIFCTSVSQSLCSIYKTTRHFDYILLRATLKALRRIYFWSLGDFFNTYQNWTFTVEEEIFVENKIKRQQNVIEISHFGCVCVCVCVYIYIYIYIHTHTGREGTAFPTCVLDGHLHRVTLPDVLLTQLILLMMSTRLLEICRELK